MGVLIALNRIDAFRRKKAIQESLEHTTAVSAARNALVLPRALKIERLSDGLSVDVTSQEHDSEIAAGIVMSALSHFVPEVSGTRAVSRRKRRTIHKAFPNIPIPERVGFHRMPLHYTVSSNDGVAFSSFLQRVKHLRLVSLGDLNKIAEAAFLETRPDGFDFQTYYRSNR